MENTARKIGEIIPRKRFIEEKEKEDYELLKELYGRKKILPRGYELPALIALSHYPELKNIAIEFRFVESDQPLETRPKKSSLLRSGTKREYEICISKKAKASIEPALMRNLSFNIQIAQFGHELGHVVDYMSRPAIQVVFQGMLFFIGSEKRRIESHTDLIAIKHGFGYLQMDYARLVQKLQKEYPDEKLYQDYFKYYMTEGDIRRKVGELKLYDQ